MKKDGFSLIEVLCSIVVVSVALVTTLGTFNMINQHYVLHQDRLMSSVLLQRKIEEIKCKNFDDVLTEGYPVTYPGYEDYPLYVEVLDSFDSDPELKKVEAFIYWGADSATRRGQEHVVTVIGNIM